MTSLNKLPPHPGWAVYLRTSLREAQNPKNSQKRQCHNIHEALILKSQMKVVDEYINVMSGWTTNRANYQRLLSDARLGRFSHVAVENAERFGFEEQVVYNGLPQIITHSFVVPRSYRLR